MSASRAAVLALGAVLLAAARPAAAGSRVVFDRTSVGPTKGPPPGRGERVLLARRTDPRVGATSLALPLAWGATGETVELDRDLGALLSLSLADFDVLESAASRLRRRAEEAGETLGRLEDRDAERLLVHEPRGTQGAGLHRAATVRVLTRGNVRDRWSLRPGLADEPAAELPARHLLQLQLVSLGLHVASDDASLPARFAYLGLRARLWNLAEGGREWDRALLVGIPLEEQADTASAFRAAVESLSAEATDRLAAELWPELGLAAEPGGGPDVDAPPAAEPLPAAAEPLPPAVEAMGDASLDRQDLRSLLARLAERRLTGPSAGEPWSRLARAVKPEVPEALAVALSCAEDPLGAAVETGSKRLGLGLADTYRRVEVSEAFRRALAEDLMKQVAGAAGDDWPLERAVRYLLSELAGRPPARAEAQAVAEPLLTRARLDGALSPEGLAALLLGARVSPESARATLAEILAR